MSTSNKAKTVIAEAQKALRSLMEEAIRQQNYGEVAEIAILAEGLSRVLLGENGGIHDPSGAPAPPTVPPVRQMPKRTNRPKNKPKYPFFERDGDKLVKVGWSKKHRDEYEHRASREAVIAVARHIASQVKVGQVFEVESMLAVQDSAGSDIPAYQVYLILAWLRSAGAVEKKGRDGQILRDGSIGSGGLNNLWERVPVRAH